MVIGLGALAMCSLFAVGCCDKENARITDLMAENGRLKSELDGMKANLNNAQEQATALQAQLDQKNRDLAAARSAGNKVVEVPLAAKTTPEGWEKGLYSDRVTVGTDILFKPGEAKLLSEGKRKLDEIANTLNTTYKGMSVVIYGYTDSDPIRKTKNLWDDNLDLSAARAMAVTRYLWSKGLPKEILDSTARGETHFVATNATKAGKSKNRRVEIIVLKEGKAMTPAAAPTAAAE
jgi:chemotaxis protein MotB